MLKSQKPKISVIMAVYNGMPFLREAVESILSQTYKNFEFIIVDDASSDGTSKYLRSIKDKRIKILKNKKNLGLAASLNKALVESRGDFIARMDADDISDKKRLKTQLDFLEKHPNIAICGAWAYLIDENGKTIGIKRFPSQPEKIKSTLIYYPCLIHPTFFARQEFFETLGGYDPDFDYAEDYELLMRAKNSFQMANVRKALLKWRLWEKRRSREDMHLMDKIDLKIKIESLKREGLNIPGIIAVTNKILMTYALPASFKTSLSRILKLA